MIFGMKGILIGLLLFSGSLSAQIDSSSVFKASVTEIMQLKVDENVTKIYSATKTEQEIAQAPNLVSIFSRKQIQQYGLISFNDILFRQAGTSVSQDYDRTTVSMRGTFESWNSNHWLMLVDGVPFNANTYGSAYTWEVTPLLFTKSVEVLRGAGSALYGANAMNGVIGINTLQIDDLQGNAEARFRIGTQGAQIYDAMVGAENNKMSMIIAFNHYQNKGTPYESYDASGRTNPDRTLKKFNTNNAVESNYFFGKLQFKGKLSGLSLQYHEQQWDFGTGLGWAFNIPDQPEHLEDFRRAVAVSYRSKPNKKFAWEAIARYQRSGWTWNMRLALDSSVFLGSVYPNGINEYVKTYVDDVFTRLQGSWEFNKAGKLLAGFENTLFYYGGDQGHQANIDLNNTFLPNPNNRMTAADGFFEYAQNHWVLSQGLYAQYISPDFFDKLSLTAGIRFDNQSFDYTDVKDADIIKNKSFSKFSPRLSLVYAATPNFHLKFIAGRAFRLPSYAELLSANTFAVASNINELRPETVTTYEWAFDWKIKNNLTWRANLFYTDFENLIAYSNSNNALATNVYTSQSGGFETEADWKINKFSGFFNYTYSKLFSEIVLDKTVSQTEVLAWVPAHTAKAGIVYQANKWYSSLSLIYQSQVNRRSSDRLPALLYSGQTIDTQNYRPYNVPAWFTANWRLAYTPSKNWEVSLQINHLLDTPRPLIKTSSYPFDYQMAKQMILLDIRLNY
jgi:outer membrane receptor protein involved in Fe transport